MSAFPYDLVGLGIGPFNLSLAALAHGVPHVRSAFFDGKAEFSWHPELMLPDATMQTSWVKDLVSAVAPTSPFSFLNYLVQNKRFYAFLNTGRMVMLRQEFEDYCRWVSRQLSGLHFNSRVRELQHVGNCFQIRLDHGTVQAQNVCIGTGLIPRIPAVARSHVGPRCFHPKSPYLSQLDAEGQRVLIVGGGQTGAEIFMNLLRGRWKKPASIQWVSRRPNLEPLDESAFTNEYFTPNYVRGFYGLHAEVKERLVQSQKLSSDGITPAYLMELNRELYRHAYVERNGTDIKIQVNRELIGLEAQGALFQASFRHRMHDTVASSACDIMILCTGFESRLPDFMEPLLGRMEQDPMGRPQVGENFRLDWDGPEANRIYAVNFSRHGHGIAEPQTSLMAWRSACILNYLLGVEAFPLHQETQGYVHF